jgi:hypothetical protein
MTMQDVTWLVSSCGVSGGFLTVANTSTEFIVT